MGGIWISCIYLNDIVTSEKREVTWKQRKSDKCKKITKHFISFIYLTLISPGKSIENQFSLAMTTRARGNNNNTKHRGHQHSTESVVFTYGLIIRHKLMHVASPLCKMFLWWTGEVKCMLSARLFFCSLALGEANKSQLTPMRILSTGPSPH